MGKLNDWHELDFAAFRKEKRAFHADIRLRERGAWEGYLRDNAAHVSEVSDRIASAEREIDRIVYGLFTGNYILRVENQMCESPTVADESAAGAPEMIPSSVDLGLTPEIINEAIMLVGDCENGGIEPWIVENVLRIAFFRARQNRHAR